MTSRPCDYCDSPSCPPACDKYIKWFNELEEVDDPPLLLWDAQGEHRWTLWSRNGEVYLHCNKGSVLSLSRKDLRPLRDILGVVIEVQDYDQGGKNDGARFVVEGYTHKRAQGQMQCMQTPRCRREVPRGAGMQTVLEADGGGILHRQVL